MPTSNRRRPGSRWLGRRLAFRLHGWCGFLLSILLFVICLSGTLAVVGHEIDWLLNPDIRVTPGSGPTAWSAIHRNVRALHPEAQVLWLGAPVGAGFAAEAVIRRHDLKQPWRVYADPRSGEIQGEASWLTAQRFLRDFHMYLFTPYWGKYIVSVFGLIMAVSVVTGIIVYRKWWKGFLTWERKRGARILWGGAHKLLGVWSLWFVALMAITGTWYFAEELLFDFTDFAYIGTPTLDDQQLSAYGAAAPLADLDTVAESARREIPSLRVAIIRLPASNKDVISVQGQTDAILVRDRANKVNFHPFSGDLVSVQLAQDLSPARRWVDTADPLHFGDFGGMLSKLIWFGFGLALNAMILTGAWLYLRRVRRHAERSEVAEALDGIPDEAAAAAEVLPHG